VGPWSDPSRLGLWPDLRGFGVWVNVQTQKGWGLVPCPYPGPKGFGDGWGSCLDPSELGFGSFRVRTQEGWVRLCLDPSGVEGWVRVLIQEGWVCVLAQGGWVRG